MRRVTSRQLDLAAGARHAVGIRMENGTTKFAQASQASVPQDYHAAPRGRIVQPDFDAAIRALAPSGTMNDICALFGRRVSYSSIKFWRYGYRPAPQWAIDTLATLLDQAIESQAALATRVRSIAPAPGKGSGSTITAWNARRAALIAEKKKPAG